MESNVIAGYRGEGCKGLYRPCTHRRGSAASAMWMYRWIAMGCAGFRASACWISASAFTADGRKLPS